MSKVLQEEDELREYLEKLRLEDEEKEKQRVLYLQRLASIAALRSKQEAAAEARRSAHFSRTSRGTSDVVTF